MVIALYFNRVGYSRGLYRTIFLGLDQDLISTRNADIFNQPYPAIKAF